VCFYKQLEELWLLAYQKNNQKQPNKNNKHNTKKLNKQKMKGYRNRCSVGGIVAQRRKQKKPMGTSEMKNPKKRDTELLLLFDVYYIHDISDLCVLCENAPRF
jgi:hypothetical protein